MDSATPIILKVSATEYKKVIVDASNGKRYYADLSYLYKVFCFPKSEEEWKMVSQDSSGFALIWSSRFEAHIDQVIGLATKVEDISKSA